MKEFVKNHFNKIAFKDVTFSEFKAVYGGKLRGRDIKEVAKELGIDTTEKKPFKAKSRGKKEEK